MKTATLAILALAASFATASGSAQAANVDVDGDDNRVTVVENHYHINNQYNVQRDYDDRAYYPRYYGYYPQSYMIVRPMVPAPVPYFFRYGVRGFYR